MADNFLIKFINENEYIKVKNINTQGVNKKKLLSGNRGRPLAIINRRLGMKDSLDGETWKACFAVIKYKSKYLCNSIFYCGLKIMPMEEDEYKREDPLDSRIWREIYILEECNRLKKYGNISLPFMYGYRLSKEMSPRLYVNKRLISRIKQKYKETLFGKYAAFIFSELADFDLEYFLKKVLTVMPDEDQTEQIKVLLFQIIYTLTELNGLISLVHFDLHIGNVLIHKKPPGGYYKYIIGNKEYYIPNLGYLYKLWDFSRSVLINQDDFEIIIRKALFNLKHLYKDPKEYEAINTIAWEKLREASKEELSILYIFDIHRFVSALFSTIKSFNIKINSDLQDSMLKLIILTRNTLIEELTVNVNKKINIKEVTPVKILESIFVEFHKRPEPIVNLLATIGPFA